MWDQVLEKIELLKELDKQYQAFGAKTHQYKFHPPLQQSDLEAIEKKLGTELPIQLAEFYLKVGNGGAGPHYGLLSAKELVLMSYHPDQPYPGAEYYQKIAEEEGGLSEDGYFEIDQDILNGLIVVIEEGCGHEICLVTKGERLGKIVYVSCNGHVHDSKKTLLDLYHSWLDREIKAFQFVKNLIESDMTAEQIAKEVVSAFDRYDGRDIMISLINVPKPASLFGSGNQEIYHGATQFPWYEKQLQRYRNKSKKRWWKF